MTQLRDARLRRALQSSPDSSAAPDASTRRSIRDAARIAVAEPVRATPWWRQVFQVQRPWNAAFASVMLAVLVGVMWRGHETTGPGGEMTVAVATAPVQSPAQSAASAPATEAKASPSVSIS